MASKQSVPDLIRDLQLQQTWVRGPGSSPGHDYRKINEFCAICIHGFLHLHCCLQIQFGHLYWGHRGRETDNEASRDRERLCTHSQIQNSQAGLFRAIPRLSRRTHQSPKAETMAQRLEEPTYRRTESKLVRLVDGGLNHLRSRIRSGTLSHSGDLSI